MVAAKVYEASIVYVLIQFGVGKVFRLKMGRKRLSKVLKRCNWLTDVFAMKMSEKSEKGVFLVFNQQ